MKRVLLMFILILLLFTFLCASKQPGNDDSVDLHEAYKIAYAEATKWDKLAEPYFITSVDDSIDYNAIKGENGKRNYWNFDFVVADTNSHLIISVHDKAVVNKIEAESEVNINYIMDIKKLRISTTEAVAIAKENYGLLPGSDWAQGYHFVLENSGVALVLSVVGRNTNGSISRIYFNAKTGEIIG